MKKEIKEKIIDPKCGQSHLWKIVRVIYPDDENDPDFIEWGYPKHILIECERCKETINVEHFSEF